MDTALYSVSSLSLPLAGISVLLLFISLYLWISKTKVKKLLREKEAGLEQALSLLMRRGPKANPSAHPEKVIESKEDFVAIVSHQLRTPATEVKWGLDELLADKTLELSSEHRAQLEALHKSSEGMVRLIDNLVRLVSLEQGFNSRFLIVPYDADGLIRATGERVAGDFAEKNIQIKFDLKYSKLISSIDSDSLTMVIQNLVENAFHYTHEGGKILISSKEESPSGMTVAITDTGIGISEDKQKTVFLKFKRSADAMKLNSGGMGLGLYIIKNIIGQYGGTVGFNSEVGKGTTFYFTLPEESSTSK